MIKKIEYLRENKWVQDGSVEAKQVRKINLLLSRLLNRLLDLVNLDLLGNKLENTVHKRHVVAKHEGAVIEVV